MIDRLKTKGKEALKKNYFMCVLVALVLAVFCSGGSSGGRDRDNHSWNYHMESIQQDLAEIADDIRHPSEMNLDHYEGRLFDDSLALMIAGVVGISAAIVAGVVLLAGFLLKTLVFQPLEIGGAKYFLENSRKSDAGFGNLGYAFRNGYYGNAVVGMFLKNLIQFLFTLLLVIPGIIKAYEYRLVPYLLADYPELSSTQVLNESKRMMDGHKMDAFLLDLSFIGWYILSGITGGIVGVFWTNPYKNATDAEFYLDLQIADIRRDELNDMRGI